MVDGLCELGWFSEEEKVNTRILQKIINNKLHRVVLHKLFRAITMFSGTNCILHNIPHIHIEDEKYST
jgi:hypothetical protein